MRIICWNVNGIRAAQRKGLLDYIAKEQPDILCLQETKAQRDQLEKELTDIEGYTSYFFSAEKKGYSGVAIYTKPKPDNVVLGCEASRFDAEGRVLRLDFKEFTLYNIYFPNGGRGPERVRYKLDFYDLLLEQWEELRAEGRPLIICGDYNTAHQEIDVAKPVEWSKTSGFLPEERLWLDKLTDMGYVDIFRKFNQSPEQYTYWDNFRNSRERNVGWRIDYFWVTPDLVSHIENATIHPEVMGSDHCPIGIALKF
jgi:exodeoxyribonuclease-3